MQHKPDKEWDSLFKNKFEDAEITPSANVWENIEAQLAPKRRRLLPIYWWAAASVVLFCSALFVFEKLEDKGFRAINQTPSVALQNKPAKAYKKTDSLIAIKPLYKKEVEVFSVASKKLRVKGKIIDKNIVTNGLKNYKVVVEQLQPTQHVKHLTKKQFEILPNDSLLIATIVPPLPALSNTAIDTASINKNTIAQTVTPKKGIRNIGELVNFLVSKVDKRDKRLIKFKTDAGDNSSIAAINLGIIQLNSKKVFNN